MPDERVIQELENLISDIVDLGGQKERTSIVPNMLVRDATPSGLDDYVIIADDRDGDNILALKVPGVVYDDNDLVNVIFPQGGEAIAFQQGSGSTTSGLWDVVTGTSDIYYDKGDVVIGDSNAPDAKLEILDALQAQLRLTHTKSTKYVDLTLDTSHNLTIAPSSTGRVILPTDLAADSFAFIVKNTSGATVATNDIGYIDEAGEFKTTTTAQERDIAWSVVIIGGANNADIHVARRGRVNIAYTGTAPSAGHYLVTSTSAGDAQRQTTMVPSVFAVALGAGAGGVVEALLLTGRTAYPITSDNDILFVSSSNDSRFTATIAAAGVSGDKVYYTLGTGNVNSITPQATTELGKMILHNTTQVEEARIIATGTDGTGDFIQVSNSADISGWVSTDAITSHSQTNAAIIGGARYFDIEMTGLPALTTELKFVAQWGDDTTVGQRALFHPFESNNNSKNVTLPSYFTTGRSLLIVEVDLQNNTWCCAWDASGVATGTILIRLRGVEVATP